MKQRVCPVPAYVLAIYILVNVARGDDQVIGGETELIARASGPGTARAIGPKVSGAIQLRVAMAKASN